MTIFRFILISLCALIATGCGGDSVQSPDFTSELIGIEISPSNASIPDGRTAQFTAMGEWTLPPGSATATELRAVSGSWSVGNSGVASIDAAGLATGEGVGSTQVNFSAKGKTASAALTVTAAVLESIRIQPGSTTISLGNAQTFTAIGTYSNATEAEVAVNWSSSNTGVATVSPSTGATSTTAQSVAQGSATITAVSGTLAPASVTLTVGPFQPTLVSMIVSPDPGSSPVGVPLQFTVAGQCTIEPFSIATGPCTPTGVTWSVGDATLAEITPTGGVAKGKTVSSTTVTASVTTSNGTVTDSARFDVTAPVLTNIEVTPANPTVALGASPTFTARGFFSDGSAGAVSVNWTSSNTAVAEVEPGPGTTTDARTLTQGTANIVATSGTISGQTTLTVGAATLSSLLRVETAAGDRTGRTTVNRKVEFVAIGSFSDGSEQVIDDANISWTSGDNGIAPIDADGFATGLTLGQTTITATRVGVSGESAFTTLTVTGDVCTTPLLDSEGATVVANFSGLCVENLLCNVTDEGNIINPSATDFASIDVVAGLLGASAGVTVAPGVSPPYAVPFTAGGNVGFIVGKPVGALAAVELTSQLFVRTLLNGNVQETTSDVTPLRVDLLGLTLTGEFETALVSFATSMPYDAVELAVNSGVASVLSRVNVFQACATSEPPPPASALVRVARVESADSPLVVGAARNFVVIGEYADGSEQALPDADIDWTSDNDAVASVSPLGVVTGEAAGSTAIRATLKDGVASGLTLGNRTAQGSVNVVASVCAAPLLASANATVDSDVSGICLLSCGVSNEDNLIDAVSTNFASLSVPLALLGGSVSVTVDANPPLPFPGVGGTAGFVVGRPVGTVASVELLAQLEVETLLNGVVQDTFTRDTPVPLRADLLGLALLGDGGDLALVSGQTTRPYDALRLTFKSGILTLGLQNYLSTVNVLQACSAVVTP